MYECNKARREGLMTSYCMGFCAERIDEAVIDRVLEVLQKDQIELAIAALHELESRDEALDKQWRMKIERAEYEAELAQRRYEQVDPANRLVASTLEKAWNAALVNAEQIRQEHQEQQNKKKLTITPEQRGQILALAQDVPRLWHEPTTQAKDRKKILHALIKDITVKKDGNQVILHMRWQGGVSEEIKVTLRPSYSDQLRYSGDFVDQIRQLAMTLSDEEIVEHLNSKGLLSAKGRQFTCKSIEWIRQKHRIPSPLPLQKREDEWTVNEVAKKFNVSKNVVYYWISRNFVDSRKLRSGWPYWITLSIEKEEELKKRVAESYKL